MDKRKFYYFLFKYPLNGQARVMLHDVPIDGTLSGNVPVSECSAGRPCHHQHFIRSSEFPVSVISY